MKIIVPIKSERYLRPLTEAGADEFYGGVLDETWQEKYGTFLEYNRRGSYGGRANIASWDELERILALCAETGKDFYLTANALRIAGQQRADYLNILERYRRIGGKKVIVSDLGVIRPLHEMGLRCTVSSCANVRNQYASAFFAEQGCERIIFPRDLTLADIAGIRDGEKRVEYEAFLSNSGCKFSDGNCLGLHGLEEGALCDYCKSRESTYYTRTGKPLPQDEQEQLQENKRSYYRLFHRACGQCMLYDLKGLVDAVKIVGRVAGEESILQEVRLAHENLQIAENVKSRREYLEHRILPSGAPGICEGYLNCYYRTDMVWRRRFGELLEQKYVAILGRMDTDRLKDAVDYVGVNLSQSASGVQVDFKLYYNTKASLKTGHPIIAALDEYHMLRAVTRIQDADRAGRERFDIGLGNRTVENMKRLYSVMCSASEILRDNLPEIRRLNQMRISDRDEYRAAALYFLGFIEQDGHIEAIKTHYLTRLCEDTDKIRLTDRFDDDYYLQFIRDSGIEPFLPLLPPVQRTLAHCGGHLWMIGADYFAHGAKYKIYIKKRGWALYSGLRYGLEPGQTDHAYDLIDALEELERWNERQPRLECDGAAISRDNTGRWTLNFYYLVE